MDNLLSPLMPAKLEKVLKNMHSLVVQLRSLLPVISLNGDLGLEQLVKCGCRPEGRNPGALGGLGLWGLLSGPLHASLPPAFADVCVQWSLPAVCLESAMAPHSFWNCSQISRVHPSIHSF